MFTVNRFAETDKDRWLVLWDELDPWSKDNNRPDIPESNWNDIVSPNGALRGFALRHNDEPVGMVLYRYNVSTKTANDECHICDIFVQPDFRRQGGASQLFAAVEDEAVTKKASRICWITNPQRAESVRFYDTFPAEKLARNHYVRWL